MSSAERLKQKKMDDLLKAYDFFKKAEATGALKKVPLTPQQEMSLRSSQALNFVGLGSES